MEDTLTLYSKVVDKINLELKGSEGEKEKILQEVSNENTLAVTLRIHLYIEKELEEVIKKIFPHFNLNRKQFNYKLESLHNLEIIDDDLYVAVSKLNGVRNKFAHDLEYGKKSDAYPALKEGLSGNILRYHELDIQEKEIFAGEIDDETKIRLLLARVWIQFKIFSTSALLKKLDLSKRLQTEVEKELI